MASRRTNLMNLPTFSQHRIPDRIPDRIPGRIPDRTLSRTPGLWLGLLLLAASTTTGARTPDNLADVEREARIVADVVRSALRNEAGDQLRISRVEPQFLAEQGVLLTVEVNTPWRGQYDYGQGWNFNERFSIPEIPSMVENILKDLQINVAPYEPEALEELRELRNEQRDLRREQRDIRADLRKERRALAKADDADDRADAEHKISRLESELAELDKQYQELSAAIDGQYQRLRNYRDGYPEANSEQPPALDPLIARTACDYGGTLKSLADDEFLTIALRRGQTTTYYAFRMVHVRRCSERNMDPDEMLRQGYAYEY